MTNNKRQKQLLKLIIHYVDVNYLCANKYFLVSKLGFLNSLVIFVGNNKIFNRNESSRISR